jgi:hypothetical protein
MEGKIGVNAHVAVVTCRDIEADQHGNMTREGKCPRHEVDDKRPSPMSPPSVYLPLEV